MNRRPLKVSQVHGNLNQVLAIQAAAPELSLSGKPPLLVRMVRAMSLANARSVVFRLMLYAIKILRAPTMTAPAVG